MARLSTDHLPRTFRVLDGHYHLGSSKDLKSYNIDERNKIDNFGVRSSPPFTHCMNKGLFILVTLVKVYGLQNSGNGPSLIFWSLSVIEPKIKNSETTNWYES